MTHAMTSLEDRDTVIRLVGGYMISNALRAGSSLGVFSRLDDSPGMTADELAASLEVSGPHLRRLLSLLVYAQLVEQGDGHLRLTSLGRALVPGRKGSMAAFTENFTSPLFQHAWDHLETSVKTGAAGFDIEHGRSVYDYLAGDNAANTLFNQAMQEEAGATAEAATALISLGPDETVVDIGAGDGTFLTTLLRTQPSARGIVFDSPAGIAAAEDVIKRAGVGDRCEAVGGDFFEAVPPSGTTYILKSVLQDWDDEHAVELLRTCREHVPAQARLIILGNFLPSSHDDDAVVGYLTDLCMLVISGGRERTLQDLDHLLGKAGFSTENVVVTRVGPLTAVELNVVP